MTGTPALLTAPQHAHHIGEKKQDWWHRRQPTLGKTGLRASSESASGCPWQTSGPDPPGWSKQCGALRRFIWMVDNFCTAHPGGWCPLREHMPLPLKQACLTVTLWGGFLSCVYFILELCVVLVWIFNICLPSSGFFPWNKHTCRSQLLQLMTMQISTIMDFGVSAPRRKNPKWLSRSENDPFCIFLSDYLQFKYLLVVFRALQSLHESKSTAASSSTFPKKTWSE